MLRLFRALAAPVLLIVMVRACALPAFADTSGFVRGTVVLNGAPTAGLRVVLTGERTTFETATDVKGAFAFSQVPFGTYTIVARAGGVKEVSEPVVVRTGQVATVTLALGDLRLLGRVGATTRGVSGTPVSQNAITKTLIAALPANDSLNSIVQTVPGIVKFSYNEPVAHGFHGLIYEIDGAPLPQTTSSNFAEIIDPKNVDSIEVFTGAFPAEFGGTREGAVVNILTKRAGDPTSGGSGALEVEGGGYGYAKSSISRGFSIGAAKLFLNVNSQRTGRGLDAPTFVPVHDKSAQSDQFLRFLTPLGKGNTLAIDASNQLAQFQIPINPAANPNDPVLNSPTQDDVQREYDRFVNLVFTHTNEAGNGYYQVIPWARYGRVAYDGDLAQALLGTFTAADGTVSPLQGLRQDRVAAYQGLRFASFKASGRHAIKYGLEGSVEQFHSNVRIAQQGLPDFLDNVAAHGSQVAAYVQDKWAPANNVSVELGLRYDRSTGFVNGNQLSPRVGINVSPDRKNILHAYFGRLYAAPALEDVRRAAVITGATTNATPVYDLKPEHDTYIEAGIAHTFAPEFRGYVNYWTRNVSNVLDTSQLANTPIFALFNNAAGRAEGLEVRLDRTLRNRASWFISGSASRSYAGGVSGGSFVVDPASLPPGLQPEDHDQSFAANGAYTHRFGPTHNWFATLQSEYGTGYPVNFQAGIARLPAHLTFDVALGREAENGKLGFSLTAQNLTNRKYILKIANGFNTTQWAPGAAIALKVSAPI